MSTEIINYTVRLPRETKDHLRDDAAKHSRSLNAHFIKIVEQYLSGDLIPLDEIAADPRSVNLIKIMTGGDLLENLPPELQERLTTAAKAANRTLANEILDRLERSFDPSVQALTAEDLERIFDERLAHLAQELIKGDDRVLAAAALATAKVQKDPDWEPDEDELNALSEFSELDNDPKPSPKDD